jgi:hypothetical protein
VHERVLTLWSPYEVLYRLHGLDGEYMYRTNDILHGEATDIRNESKWRGSGEENERLKARPLDLHTAEDMPAQFWRQADLRPGDMLYLPTSWWHAVLSNKHTVMTNVWTSPR